MRFVALNTGVYGLFLDNRKCDKFRAPSTYLLCHKSYKNFSIQYNVTAGYNLLATETVSFESPL
jgi:hypothetical protein